jgi:hypothetical protein
MDFFAVALIIVLILAILFMLGYVTWQFISGNTTSVQ